MEHLLKSLLKKNTMYLHQNQLESHDYTGFTFTHYNIEIYLKNRETSERGWEIDFISIFSMIELTKEEKKYLLTLIPNFDCLIAW
jgi:hypothetical protein